MTQTSDDRGDLVIRTVAMPADTNFNGDIFGGWLLSQMDLGGAIAARKVSQSRVTTIAIEKMVFKRPVHVGDTVCCYEKLLKVGRTSMTFALSAWILPDGFGEREQVTEAIFTYVAIDEAERPIPVEREKNRL